MMAVARASQVGRSVDAFYSFKILITQQQERQDTALKRELKLLHFLLQFIIASLKHDGGEMVRRTDASVNGQRKKV